MRNKLLGLAAILALGTTGGIIVQQTITTSVEQNQSSEDIEQYTQPLPTNVDYTTTYDLPKNSQYMTTYVNIDGLATGNDSLNRTYKLDLIETNASTSVSNTYTVSSFTTPSTVSTNGQYTNTATIQHTFDFTTYTYSLDLSVLDTSNSTWTVVDSSSVINTPNKSAPSVTDSYYTTTRPDLGVTNGSITWHMVINNPNSLNYNVTVFLTNTTTNATQTQVITNGTNDVTFSGLGEGTYMLTMQSSTVYGITNQPVYITLLPDIHIPSASFTAQGVGSPRPGVGGTIYTCGNIADTNGATNVVVQTSKDGGATWQTNDQGNCYTYENVAPGTYQVQGRVQYDWDGYTHTYDLGTQTVIINSTAWTSPVGTMTLTSTNETSPVSSDGTISGSVNYSNYNHNVTYAEISIDGTNWYDIESGITGLDSGTYTVYGRFHWTDGITNADNVTTMTSKQVTVGYNNWGAPDISLTAEMDQAVNPTSDATIHADVNIDSDTTGGQGSITEYISVSTTAGSYNWQQSSGIYTYSLAPGQTVYVTGKIAYDHDNNASTAKVEVLTQTQTFTYNANPWVAPTLGVSNTVSDLQAGTPGTGDINVKITNTSGDSEAISSITINIKNPDGSIKETVTINNPVFDSNGVLNYTFQDVTQGIYYVDYSFQYNLQDGNGTQSSPASSAGIVYNSTGTNPVLGIQPAVVTPTSANGVNDGTASINYSITDSGARIEDGSIVASLQKWNNTTNQYEDVANSNRAIAETTPNPSVGTLSWTGLSTGDYKLKITFDGWNGTAFVPMEYTSQISFSILRGWTYPATVTSQTPNLPVDNTLTPTIDPVTGEEVATLNYNLTATNPDFISYGVQVSIYDKDMGVVTQTQTISQGETTATFTGLRPGDYEIRISYAPGTSPTTLGGLNTTTIPFTVKTLSSAPYVSDEQIKFTKYSDTEAMFNYYLEIQNPYNKDFQFRVYMYDLTTNKIIADETVISNGEGYVSIGWAVYNIQKDHNYALVITDFQGNMVKDLQLGYRTFGDNYDGSSSNKWWDDMETSTPWDYNFMTWGLIITVIGAGLLIGGGVSYRYFYKQHKNKVAKKSKNQVK